FMPNQSNLRRGDFPSASYGISYGGGRKPGNVAVQSKNNLRVFHSLFSNPYIERLLGHVDRSLDLFAPQLHKYMALVLDGICQQYPQLHRFCDKSAYACCCFNLGPRVRTHRHTDHLNIPFGWCAITALGRFDPKRGGHLILWSLGLLIEFPPGTTIYIPSAVVEHSNIPVQADEDRFSIVQWMPGPLCRW
ncbi:hypothetical protein NEOLEDRAFT_1023293, partial [Neolentinus lepideus HHB14362 ss-1]